jgi:stage V sporulation protein AA
MMYVQLRPRVTARPPLTLGHIAHVYGSDVVAPHRWTAMQLPVQPQAPLAVIELASVISWLRTAGMDDDIVPIGVPAAVVIWERAAHPWRVRIVAACAAVFLFFGAAVTMVHFHTEVAMADVHVRLAQLLTGRASASTVLQAAYAIGIGLGMIGFFYRVPWTSHPLHPSPLDVEMHAYEQKVLQHIATEARR